MGRRRHKQPIYCNVVQICREYLKSRQSGRRQIEATARVLRAFCGYLENYRIELPKISIEHVDSFLAAFNTPYAILCNRYRTNFSA